MKVLVNTSYWLMILALILCCNVAIVNKNFRDNQINTSLENATDYALDKMYDYYMDNSPRFNSTANANEVWVNDLTRVFAESVSETITAKGKIKISVLSADIPTGTFDIVVTQTYDYGILGKQGTCSCERAVTFVN